MHPIVLGPGFLGGIEVEAGAEAEVPGIVRVARHAGATGAGVRRDDNQAQLGGHALGAGLLHEVFVSTGQTGQPIQHRQLAALLRLRWQVDGKGHVATEHIGMMLVAFMPAAEALLA